jgi:hypothetical protein
MQQTPFVAGDGRNEVLERSFVAGDRCSGGEFRPGERVRRASDLFTALTLCLLARFLAWIALADRDWCLVLCRAFCCRSGQ